MKAIDQHYTPSYLATQMISYARGVSQNVIADFAAGDGRLLVAALNRWPSAQIIATDLSLESSDFLASKFEDWHTGQCDFTDAISRARCSALNKKEGSVTLGLLNPPFSFRGTRFWKVEIDGFEINCSIALAFVLNTIAYLSKGGEIIAVLPEGCLYNENDEQARNTLKKYMQFEVVERNNNRMFSGCSPRTVLARFTKLGSLQNKPLVNISKKFLLDNAPKEHSDRHLTVQIVRGKFPVNKLQAFEKDALPLIHSTELTEVGVDLNKRKVNKDLSTIVGPAVLLPRVGRPNINKIHVYLEPKPVVLSDCVIALCCLSTVEALTICSTLKLFWSDIQDEYKGTCALHISLKRLKFLLNSLGIEATVLTSSANSPGLKIHR